MKRELRANILVIFVCLLLYGSNIWFKKQTFSYEYVFIRNHLNDMMAPMVVLSYAGVLLNIKNCRAVHSKLQIFIICLACSLMWEYFAKFFNPDTVSDWYDVLCIFAGGFIYWLYISLIMRGERGNG